MNLTETPYGLGMRGNVLVVDVYLDKIVFREPGAERSKSGPAMHSFAPLYIAGEPEPICAGALRKDLFPPGRSPYALEQRSKESIRLNQPMMLPFGAPWVLLDTKHSRPKRFIRLSELVRIVKGRRNCAYLVFNDYIYQLTRERTGLGLLMDEIKARFPTKLVNLVPHDKVTCFTEWNDSDLFLLPGNAIAVDRIEIVSFVPETSGSDIIVGDASSPRPKFGGEPPAEGHRPA